MDGVVYYFAILDLDKIGKMDDYRYYLYDKASGWQLDENNIISDRIIGYDKTEEIDSPYRIGNTAMMNCIEQISELDALKIINEM